jgi:hypothetical protein
LHEKIRELAERDDVSINQFIATAVAEKAAALLTVKYLEDRADRADPRLLDRILAGVPDVAPVPGDDLPPDVRQAPKPVQPTRRARRQTTKKRKARAPRG